MTNDRCRRFLLVQYIINSVQYRHVHFIFLVDLTHTLGSIISLGYHFHLQLRCLHGISFTDHGSESTVTAEPGISGNQQIAKVDGVGDIPLQPVYGVHEITHLLNSVRDKYGLEVIAIFHPMANTGGDSVHVLQYGGVFDTGDILTEGIL